MDILEGVDGSVYFPACGPQAEGIKPNLPRWTLPKASRDQAKHVFISNHHKQDSLGRDSPGHAYQPRRQRSLPSWGFGTAAARPSAAPNKYGEQVNDLVGIQCDVAQVKYKNKNIGMPQASRDAAANSPDFEGFPPGAISPGPQRYTPGKAATYSFRFSHAKEIDQIPPSWTMRMKTKIIELESGTPAKVGPGLYPLPSACGEQFDHKTSLPRWKINRMDRACNKIVSDSGRLWDGQGIQKEANQRSFNRPPSFSFGTSTRFHAARLARVENDLDKGPAAVMGNYHQPHPKRMDSRHDMMKYSELPVG